MGVGFVYKEGGTIHLSTEHANSSFVSTRNCLFTLCGFGAYRSLKLGLADYQKFLDDLAKAKKVDLAEIRDKMIQCGPPGTTGTTVRKKQDC